MRITEMVEGEVLLHVTACIMTAMFLACHLLWVACVSCNSMWVTHCSSGRQERLACDTHTYDPCSLTCLEGAGELTNQSTK